MLAIYVFVAAGLAELVLWLPGVWRLRRALTVLFGLVTLAASLYLLVSLPTFGTAIVAFISLYRMFNLARVARGQLKEPRLHNVSLQTAATLFAGQLAVLCLTELVSHYDLDRLLWWAVALAQLAAAGGLLTSLFRNIKLAGKLPGEAEPRPLPTLTVAIPARNETDSLEACLQSLVASDYPKLEIIVLDDCSQTKRTPEIIRGFAHDGVEFLAGRVTPDGWLAKNWAYQQLLEAANGDLLLFAGVDVRFAAGSLRAMITRLQAGKYSMLGVVPKNEHQKAMGFQAMLIQPMRYAWELALPRWLFRRPPVLSTCWLAKKSLLTKAGGFKAVTHSVSPESYFARQCAKNGKYHLMLSDSQTDVVSLKALDDQRDTAVRTRYPQLHRRPEQVCLMSLVQISLLLAPWAFLVAFALRGSVGLFIVSALTSAVLVGGYARLVQLTYRQFYPLSLVALPMAAASNLLWLHVSMYRYEFSEVIWKGRNVCLPLYQVEAQLPALDKGAKMEHATH